MMNKNIKYELFKTILLIIVFIAIVLLNNFFILNRIEQERTAHILELKEQIKNLQSRINLNVENIENLDK